MTTTTKRLMQCSLELMRGVPCNGQILVCIRPGAGPAAPWIETTLSELREIAGSEGIG